MESEPGAETADAIDTVEMAAAMRAKRLQEFIKGRRDHLELSQEDVAARLDISARAYGNWERGRVKEWTDRKLCALAEALEMTEYQVERLFRIAVERAPQPDLHALLLKTLPQDPATTAFLDDYRVMMDALSLPTILIDHRWYSKIANKAYRDLFSGVRPHPTAMPARSFLRFGLFHPDAPSILADHTNWQLSMLAQLASSLEKHDQDPALQAIRREVYLHPALHHAYINDMPSWVLSAGADLVHNEGAVRALRHPDPQVGLQGCRLVEETPRSLQALGLTRITFVLTELDDDFGPQGCTQERGHAHDRHAA
ncbi:MmyB family transcriptional regulator [Streptomyces sp. 7N604]|uniref:MmyB family transcriptional regulator n=1 Tax=Streptomyces sp. 7N604 TaxID=3457415 RepID=UPI003FCF5B49